MFEGLLVGQAIYIVKWDSVEMVGFLLPFVLGEELLRRNVRHFATVCAV